MKRRFFKPVIGLFLGVAVCLGLGHRWIAGARRIEAGPAALQPAVGDAWAVTPAADNSSGAGVEAPAANATEALQIVRVALLEESLRRKDLTDADRSSIKTLFHEWAMAAPKEATVWAAAQWDDSGDQDLVHQLKIEAGLAWAARDFDSALAWAAGRRDAIYSGGYVSLVLANLAQSDPVRAASALSQQTLEIMSVAAPEVLTAWARTDPAAASVWVKASGLSAFEIQDNLALIAYVNRTTAGAGADNRQ